MTDPCNTRNFEVQKLQILATLAIWRFQSVRSLQHSQLFGGTPGHFETPLGSTPTPHRDPNAVRQGVRAHPWWIPGAPVRISCSYRKAAHSARLYSWVGWTKGIGLPGVRPILPWANPKGFAQAPGWPPRDWNPLDMRRSWSSHALSQHWRQRPMLATGMFSRVGGGGTAFTWMDERDSRLFPRFISRSRLGVACRWFNMRIPWAGSITKDPFQPGSAPGVYFYTSLWDGHSKCPSHRDV